MKDEGFDVCYKGRAPQTQAHVPPGWYPRTPFVDTRIFRGARVAPYGANMAVVLYRSSGNTGCVLIQQSDIMCTIFALLHRHTVHVRQVYSAHMWCLAARSIFYCVGLTQCTLNVRRRTSHKVRLLYNEQIMRIPGCSSHGACVL